MANDSPVELAKKKKKMVQIQSDNGSQNGAGFSGDVGQNMVKIWDRPCKFVTLH